MKSIGLYGALNRANARTHITGAAGSTLGMMLGGGAIALAGISFITNMQLSDIIAWMDRYFGVTFSVLFTGLLIVCVYAIAKVSRQQSTAFWAQVGAQAANGISTLALTFTLLGISLGIGALAEQSLSVENVNSIISALTAQFSMAFMTTVVGLPASTCVRAWLSILLTKQMLHETEQTPTHVNTSAAPIAGKTTTAI